MVCANLRRKLLAFLFLISDFCFLFSGSVHAYVEAPHSLGLVCSLSTNIMVLRVEKVDRQNNLIIYRKVRDIKGQHPTDVIKHNIGRGGFHPREWQYAMEWAGVGKTAVFLHNGGASETCIGTYWYQAYANGEWWGMRHGETYLLRSFAGNVDRLAAAASDIVAGKEVVVPCMVDGNKDDLHLRRARIQRLKASLKLQDYDPKRDFVGWGGEDFVRLYGMPGFTHLSTLTRVDPEAQAIARVDYDGDGRPDILLGNGFHGLRLYRNKGPTSLSPEALVPNLGKWHYIGPFDNTGQKGFDAVYPPEKEINLAQKYLGKGGEQAVWK